ncbi:MAG TPA: ABC transporter ATP-binding protein [Ramlibacter sp.]|uniref:ABC transporter ATP-binding protein n=1 Tax=Ramlibacter sp. TaxID=1917967 RepID=UPI002D7FA676|nr:ABC transporter ATP-binding protein [Ramlibacter sp.]HET8745434.1 ABC transporter ATP-binding protein [Ramlibacter sp.]
MTSRLRTVVLECLREQRVSLALAALALLGVVLCELLVPWPMKLIFDHILLAKPLPPDLQALQPLLALGAWPALVVCAVAIAVIALASGVLAYLQLYTSARIGHRITWRLRGELFAHLQRLSLAHHRTTRVGELITKVAGDTNLLRDMFSDWLLTVGRHGVTLLAMLAVMFWLNAALALVVAATLPPLLLVMYLLNRRIKAAAREQRKHEGRMASRLNEVLSHIALVQAFGRHEAEEERFRREIAANYESGMRSARVNGAIVRAIAVVSAVGTAITVLVGAREVLAGRLTPGELLVFVSYVAALYKPVRDLGRLAGKFSRASISVERVAQILDIAPDAEDAPDAIALTHTLGEITFENVSFAYQPGRPVLQGLNLRIAPGERVALLGASGAGKSTLMNLLLRLAEPSAGRILIDGIDIRRYTRASLRAALGVVPQEPMLFAVSVRENIAYGRPDATMEEIEAAARAARAHEFIIDLPQGYDTELAERAANLSGGQRQRLCLARALLREPAILLMDEPTAAVDPHSARLIHEAVARVHRDRTLILITHDPASLAGYDRVLTLEKGHLAPASRPAALSLVDLRHG